jgi:hypothetical protein
VNTEYLDRERPGMDAPAARRDTSKDRSMPFGARLMFDYITDCSLWEKMNESPGVICFSNGDLASHFGVKIECVRRWKRMLEDRGRIWLTQKWLKNSWPATVYHVAAIVGPPPAKKDKGHRAQDEVWRHSNKHRLESIKRGQKGVFACATTENNEEKSQVVAVSSGNVAKSPATRVLNHPPRGTVKTRRAGLLKPAARVITNPPGGTIQTRAEGDYKPASRVITNPPGGSPVTHYTESGGKRLSPLKGVESKSPPVATLAGDNPLEDWKQSFAGAFRSVMLREERRVRAALAAEADSGKVEDALILSEQLSFLRLKLYGPVKQKPFPVREIPKVNPPVPAMSDSARAAAAEEMRKLRKAI